MRVGIMKEKIFLAPKIFFIVSAAGPFHRQQKKTRIFNTLFKDNGEGSEAPPTKNSKSAKNVIG
jgi:hypothetical protein